MKAETVKRRIMPLFLASSLLSVLAVVSVLTAHAQGRRGGESRSGGGGESRSGSSRSGGESRSSSSGSGNRVRSDSASRSRSSSSSGVESRSNRSERQARERTSDNNSQGSGSDDSRSWTRHRDRHRHRDRDRDKDRDRIRDEQARAYRNTSVYQSSNYGSYSSDAYDRGYQDGLFTGASDARRGQSYVPERSHFYRRGAPGFFSSFGYRGGDRDAYREGFMRGYEEGYRHYEMYFSGGRFHL